MSNTCRSIVNPTEKKQVKHDAWEASATTNESDMAAQAQPYAATFVGKVYKIQSFNLCTERVCSMGSVQCGLSLVLVTETVNLMVLVGSLGLVWIADGSSILHLLGLLFVLCWE